MKRIYWIISILAILVIGSLVFGKHLFIPIQADSPPSLIEFTLPDFTIDTQGEDDIVVIPGCVYTSTLDKPYVPYIQKIYTYSPGFAIQNVTLEVRSQIKEGKGLRIPNYKMETDKANTEPVIPDEEKDQWFPEKDFEWTVDEKPDGSKMLMVSVFPFYYNSKTLEYKYIQHYKLNVDFIPSYLQIDEFNPEKDVYDPQDTVVFSAKFSYNDAKVIQAFASIMLMDINRQIVDTVPMVDLVDIEAEENKATFEWKNEKHLMGHYQAILEIRDYESKLLDFKRTSVQIGRPVIKVVDMSVSPRQIKPGDSVQVIIKIQNQGTLKVEEGLLVLKIQSEEQEVKRFEKAFKALGSGEYLSIQETWKTVELQKGQKYVCIGTAYYSGEASEPMTTVLSTNNPPVARMVVNPETAEVGKEILFDASGSVDSDGEISAYQWIFGDNVELSDKIVTHDFNVPGKYAVKLIVTDNAGDTAEVVKEIVIQPKKEEPPPSPDKIVIRLFIGQKRYFVNDQPKEMDTAPIILEGRTLLPIRYVAEALGATVGWVATEQKATIDFKGISIELWIGKNTAKVNNEYTLIDPSNPEVKPIIVPPGRTMLPIRFIAETLGCQVDWDATAQEVKITYPK